MGKLVHKVQYLNKHGDGSALCFKRVHPINMQKDDGVLYWESGVTCPKCLALKPSAEQAAKERG